MAASSVAGIVITHAINWSRGDADAFALGALLHRCAATSSPLRILRSLSSDHASLPTRSQRPNYGLRDRGHSGPQRSLLKRLTTPDQQFERRADLEMTRPARNAIAWQASARRAAGVCLDGPATRSQTHACHRLLVSVGQPPAFSRGHPRSLAEDGARNQSTHYMLRPRLCRVPQPSPLPRLWRD